MNEIRKKRAELFDELTHSHQEIDRLKKIETKFKDIESQIRHKRSRTFLPEMQNWLKKVLVGNSIMVYFCEPSKKGRITFMSDNVKSQLGYDAADVVQDHQFWVNHLHSDDVPKVIPMAGIALKNGSANAEYRFLHCEGEYRWLYDEVVALTRDDGGISGLMGFRLDITAYKNAVDALKDCEDKLKLNTKDLSRKEITITEMLTQLENEKKKMYSNEINNIHKLLFPILKKIKRTHTSAKYIDLLQHTLEQMTSSFGTKISDVSINLTPREIEVCNMIGYGLSSKDISKYYNLSLETVKKHRMNVRKKLAISNKGVNLASFLQSL